MKLAVLFVLALTLPPALSGKAERPPAVAETRPRFAALDEVHLLANGLLQVGQSLREFAQKTKGQIHDIAQKLNIFDRSFYQLSMLASEIREEEEELKKTTVVLKANIEEIKNLSLEIRSKVEGILRERGQLQSQVRGLEEKLSSLTRDLEAPKQLPDIGTLKAVIQTQDRSIAQLLLAVREQREQLNHQRTKIKSLEDKTSIQETMERASLLFPSAESTLAPYLTDPSANSTEDLPADCSELHRRGGRTSGVYAIKPNQSEPFMVYCDMNSDGGLTVIQRRKDGSVNFDQTWEKYENGFGDLRGEFWLGLKKIHALASLGGSLLHIVVGDWRQGSRSIQYNTFSLGGPESRYALHLGQPAGDLPDAMSRHGGTTFSTKDRDHGNLEETQCLYDHTGGWWFNACGDTNLNGRYVRARSKSRLGRKRGVYWRPQRRSSFSLRFIQISIGPASSHNPSTTSALTSASASSETGNFL
ncbi:angiopoietin-related protein 3-like [Aplochiton taeniatus]